MNPADNKRYIIPVGSRVNEFWGNNGYADDNTLTIDSDWTTNNTYTIEPLWNDFDGGTTNGDITFSKVAADDPAMSGVCREF